jgi:hypothetical protein
MVDQLRAEIRELKASRNYAERRVEELGKLLLESHFSEAGGGYATEPRRRLGWQTSAAIEIFNTGPDVNVESMTLSPKDGAVLVAGVSMVYIFGCIVFYAELYYYVYKCDEKKARSPQGCKLEELCWVASSAAASTSNTNGGLFKGVGNDVVPLLARIDFYYFSCTTQSTVRHNLEPMLPCSLMSTVI